MIRKFRKKPVVIEATQYKGELNPEINDFARGFLLIVLEPLSVRLQTLEGHSYELKSGDWIIKGVKGEFYPCKPDIFEQTYEEVGDKENGDDGNK